jgi:3-phenylpropionate/trans-cinnamate dioxygenase ferredoxin reductase subunit
MPARTHVIVGASLAGATAATTLRKEGFDGRIVLIGDETELPYERPELSKGYLTGTGTKSLFVHPDDAYVDADIDLRLGQKVQRIEPEARRVVVDGAAVPYDRLLLATGARPRRPTGPGADLDGVLTLRTMADADAIRARALTATSIVVVGGGWIGSEVAASLRSMDLPVTLVMATPRPLETVLGPQVGEIYRAAHERHGVRLVTGSMVARFDGDTSVAGVRLEDGRRIPADLVVVGIGAEPRTGLAIEAGFAVDDGILVDDRLETSVAGVFAAGDVANAIHPTYERRLRLEHWDNARRQARTAAANMLGARTRYARIPYFYSDQYELGMEYRGFAPTWDEVVVRGDPGSGEFLAFWLRADRVAAAMNVNVWDMGPALQALVAAAATVDRSQLADTARPLTELTRAA